MLIDQHRRVVSRLSSEPQYGRSAERGAHLILKLAGHCHRTAEDDGVCDALLLHPSQRAGRKTRLSGADQQKRRTMTVDHRACRHGVDHRHSVCDEHRL